MAKRPKREEIEEKIKEIETELLDLSKRQQDISKEFNQGVQYAIGYAVGSIERIFKPILEPEEKSGDGRIHLICPRWDKAKSEG